MANYRFTLGDIIDAAKKNGLKHIRGEWFEVDPETERLGGCILGQTLYNLIGDEATIDEGGFLWDNFANALNELDPDQQIGSRIIQYNDTPKQSGKYRHYSDLVRMLERRLSKFGRSKSILFSDGTTNEDEWDESELDPIEV